MAVEKRAPLGRGQNVHTHTLSAANALAAEMVGSPAAAASRPDPVGSVAQSVSVGRASRPARAPRTFEESIAQAARAVPVAAESVEAVSFGETEEERLEAAARLLDSLSPEDLQSLEVVQQQRDWDGLSEVPDYSDVSDEVEYIGLDDDESGEL